MKPDKFEPTLISRTNDYVYFEFQSPTFGFIDDVRPRHALHCLVQHGKAVVSWHVASQCTCRGILTALAPGCVQSAHRLHVHLSVALHSCQASAFKLLPSSQASASCRSNSSSPERTRR